MDVRCARCGQTFEQTAGVLPLALDFVCSRCSQPPPSETVPGESHIQAGAPEPDSAAAGPSADAPRPWEEKEDALAIPPPLAELSGQGFAKAAMLTIGGACLLKAASAVYSYLFASVAQDFRDGVIFRFHDSTLSERQTLALGLDWRSWGRDSSTSSGSSILAGLFLMSAIRKIMRLQQSKYEVMLIASGMQENEKANEDRSPEEEEPVDGDAGNP